MKIFENGMFSFLKNYNIKIVNESLKNEQSIPDNIMIDIIEERINKKDC